MPAGWIVTHREAVAAAAAGRSRRWLAGRGALGGAEPASRAPWCEPNIVLITTDDQTLASLAVMKRVRRLLGRPRARRSSDNIASFPLCCPSRATWITGQYAHNHGVIDNQERNGGGYRVAAGPRRRAARVARTSPATTRRWSASGCTTTGR